MTAAKAVTATISEAKLEANRANAQHSTGPVTEEGRAAVRMNATRHGITATISLLPDAERAAFDDLCARLKSGYNPVGEVELQYFQDIAEAQWRFNRALAAEDNLIALQIANHPDDWLMQLTAKSSETTGAPTGTCALCFACGEKQVANRCRHSTDRSESYSYCIAPDLLHIPSFELLL